MQNGHLLGGCSAASTCSVPKRDQKSLSFAENNGSPKKLGAVKSVNIGYSEHTEYYTWNQNKTLNSSLFQWYVINLYQFGVGCIFRVILAHQNKSGKPPLSFQESENLIEY